MDTDLRSALHERLQAHGFAEESYTLDVRPVTNNRYVVEMLWLPTEGEDVGHAYTLVYEVANTEDEALLAAISEVPAAALAAGVSL